PPVVRQRSVRFLDLRSRRKKFPTSWRRSSTSIWNVAVKANVSSTPSNVLAWSRSRSTSMPKLIDQHGQLLKDPWVLVSKDATLEQALAETSQHLLVHVALWNAHKDELRNSGRAIAVWLDSSDQADAIAAADLPALPLVALNFPTFMDGRSYSTAV